MKFRLNIAITIIVPLLAGIAAAQTLPSNPLADQMPANLPEGLGGPIHFFSFDGAIIDEVTGAVPSLAQGYSATEGYIGGAIHLDGSGMIELPLDLTPEALKNMTIVAMVKPDALPADPDLRAEIWPTGYVLSDSQGLVYLSNQNRETSYFAAYTTSTVISNSAHPALRDGWQMVALARKQENRTTAEGDLKPHAVLTLYTNGRVSESVSLWQGDGAAPTLRLGSISIGRGDKFRGSIDHLIIYDRALTSDELLQLNGVLRQSRNGTSRGLPSSVVGDRQLPRQINGDQVISDSGIGSDQQFPGDMFDTENEENIATIKPILMPAFIPPKSDDSEAPGVLVDLGRIRDASGTPTRSSTVAEGIERANDAKRARDKAARDEAVRQAGVENSNARDIATPLTVDSTAQSGGVRAPVLVSEAVRQAGVENSNARDIATPLIVDSTAQSGDVRTPALVNEAVRQAGIENSKTIDVADPGLTLPDSREDDLKQITDTKEGQDMLKTADWRLVGVVRRSKTELYPGDEITMTIRVKKDDPANKIPNVVLNVNPHMRGMSNAVLPFRVMTSDQKPTASRDIPVTMTVPENLEFPDGADRTSWRLVARLTAENGYVLKDAIPDNHQQEIFLRVDKPAVAEECDEVVENEGGTRTAKECQSLFGLFGESPAAPNLGDDDHEESKKLENYRFFTDHSVLVSTDLPFGASHENDARELLLFEETKALVKGIWIQSKNNKPCQAYVSDYQKYDRTEDAEHTLMAKHCDGSGGNFGIEVAPSEAITGLKVCRNRANNRLKGFGLEYRQILNDGSLSTSVRYKEDELPNCARWTEISRCHPGSVAAGVEFMVASGSALAPGNFFHSINLFCGRLEVRDTDVAN